jgi:hypothetical protein
MTIRLLYRRIVFYNRNVLYTSIVKNVRKLIFNNNFLTNIHESYQLNETYLINYIFDTFNSKNFINEQTLKEKYSYPIGVPDIVIDNICFQITRSSSSEHLLLMIKEKVYKSLSFINKFNFNCDKFVIVIWISSNKIISEECIEYIKYLYENINLFEIEFYIPDDEINEKCQIFPKFFNKPRLIIKSDYDIDYEINRYNKKEIVFNEDFIESYNIFD